MSKIICLRQSANTQQIVTLQSQHQKRPIKFFERRITEVFMDFLSRCHITRPLSSTAVIALGLVTLSGCQSLQKAPNAAPTPVVATTIPAPAPVTTPSDTAPHAANTTDTYRRLLLHSLLINGKIASPPQNKQAGFMCGHSKDKILPLTPGALNAGETTLATTVNLPPHQ